MSWVVQSEYGIFNGTGWGKLDEAKLFPIGPEAQETADALHLADCSFNHEKARDTQSRFTVRNYITGKTYIPAPLIDNKRFFLRVGDSRLPKRAREINTTLGQGSMIL
jgi:hypothetical protein